ncbi:hypothetical protein PINS_up011941 [Pythium insidiosum]|nr:hypothetical protein PINS_up011941 [Pythium insidiosum]
MQHVEVDDDSSDTLVSIYQSVQHMAKQNADPLQAESNRVLLQQFSAFLEQHFIPFTMDENDETTIIVFGGAARLRCPFDMASIECANEQILARLHALVTKFHASSSPTSLEL